MSKIRNLTSLGKYISSYPNSSSIKFNSTMLPGGSNINSLTTYSTLANLIATTPTAGKVGYVQETKSLYVYVPNYWQPITTQNLYPVDNTASENLIYYIPVGGAPATLTFNITDPEGLPLTWSNYSVVGSLEHNGGVSATITQNNNIVTITPTANEEYAGYFSLIFSVSDGLNVINLNPIHIKIGRNTAILTTISSPEIDAQNPSTLYGYAVDISNNYIIVGSPGENNPYNMNGAGVVYIFNAATHELLHIIENPNPAINDNFGTVVAVSNNYAIVGSYLIDDGANISSGKAYIYNASTGALLYTLDNPNAYGTTTSDYFGWAVDITDNYAVVSAYKEDESLQTDSGKAYIFSTTTGALLYTLNNPNAFSTSAGDAFGISVALTDTYTVVGAYAEDVSTTVLSSGVVYIFSTTTGSLLRTINNPNTYSTADSDWFGVSVSISPDSSRLIVGAYLEDFSTTVTSAGIAYIFNPDTGALLYTLTDPNAYSTATGDYFGWSVAISDNYAIVGAYQEDDASGIASGKAYLYSALNGTLTYTLNNPNIYSTSANDRFGYAVAVSDNYALVGAYGEGLGGDTNFGTAYVISTSTGSLTTTLTKPTNIIIDDNKFGTSIDMSPNYTIVGAPWTSTNLVIPGRAYIYSNQTQQLLWTLDNPLSANDRFGQAVALTDTYTIIGAPGADDAGGTASGKAYIYNTATGALLYTLDNPNAFSTSLNDNFGYSVDISDNYIIVGAYLEDTTTTQVSSGKAYIYDTATGALLWTLNNPNAFSTATNDYFSYSVAISDNYAIVGAYLEDETTTLVSSGKVYIFSPATGALLWTLNNPNAYSTSTNDYFGYSVAISDYFAAVGAYLEEPDTNIESGAVYIFDLRSQELLYTLTDPNIYDSSSFDNFGYSVAISNNCVIVGAPLEDAVDGNQSGAAYIFDLTTGNLLFSFSNTNAYSTSDGDNFGYAVAITNNYAAVGAPNEDTDRGSKAGAAYLYKI